MKRKAFTAPSSQQLRDPDAEAARREHADKIRELQQMPAALLDVIPNIQLEDGVDKPIAHQLGRIPQWFRESCVRGAVTAGVITEVTGTQYDPTKYLVLRADGYGATITFALAVM